MNKILLHQIQRLPKNVKVSLYAVYSFVPLTDLLHHRDAGGLFQNHAYNRPEKNFKKKSQKKILRCACNVLLKLRLKCLFGFFRERILWMFQECILKDIFQQCLFHFQISFYNFIWFGWAKVDIELHVSHGQCFDHSMRALRILAVWSFSNCVRPRYSL